MAGKEVTGHSFTSHGEGFIWPVFDVTDVNYIGTR